MFGYDQQHEETPKEKAQRLARERQNEYRKMRGTDGRLEDMEDTLRRIEKLLARISEKYGDTTTEDSEGI